MALVECKHCRRIYNGYEGQRICPDCTRKLEEIYGHVHEYMRDNQDRNFDLETLADEMDISPVDIQALVDLGYIERDLQTYSRDKKGSRQKLAEAIGAEADKLKRNMSAYSGVYSRTKREDKRQYIYDIQHKKS